MNLMLLLFLLVVVVSTVLAKEKNFLDMTMHLVYMIVFLFIAGLIIPKLAINYESLESMFTEEQLSFIKIDPSLEELPANIKTELLAEYPHFGEIADITEGGNAERAIGFMLAGGVIMILLTLFAIVKIVFSPISKAFDLVTKLPVIEVIDMVLAMVLGAVRGLLWVWVLMIIISFFGATAIGSIMLKQIGESMILTFLYENNLIIHLFF